MNPKESSQVLITGGAGFVGTNLADHLARTGNRVLIYDNLSRPGVERNLLWLKERHGSRIHPIIGDLRNEELLSGAVAQASSVFHLAAQVAVTTSLINPIEDFEVNARGTLNLLEAIRKHNPEVPLLFTSTNKVLGGLDDIVLKVEGERYLPFDARIRNHGINEVHGIEFCSPYGCSKGAADQYVLDYARSFGIRASVFRMSCIYGPHQFGTEDQGWVAHFLIQALKGLPIVIYGDGKQVRDTLFVGDLIRALMAARENIDQIQGEAFNIGGGPTNTLSLLELVHLIEEMTGQSLRVEFQNWRPSDQRYYVSDIRKFSEKAHWAPQVPLDSGLQILHRWVVTHHPEIAAGKLTPQKGPTPRELQAS